MRSWPISAQVYNVGLMAISGCILILTFPSLVVARPQDLALFVAAAIAIAIAATHRIPITYRTVVSISAGLSFASILLLGLSLATWTTGLGYALAYGYLTLYKKRWPWYTGAFNVSTYVITTAGTAYLYEVLGGNAEITVSVQTSIALFSAGITYFIANSGLVQILIALRWQRNLWTSWISTVQEGGGEYFTLILLAVLTAIVYSYSPWALILIIPPFLIVYHSLQTSQELRVQTIEAVQALADTVDSRDPYTFEHSQRMAEYAKGIAKELDLPAEEIEVIELSARVHDLGKIGITDLILQKPGRLTQEERLEVQQHVRIGAEILQEFPRYREGRDIVYYHHERYDGNGYLEGLKGDEIPIGSRVIAVADAYDAMTTDRPYRKAITHEAAVDELKKHSGTQFDPVVVGAFLKYLDRQRAQAQQEEPAPQPAP